MKMRTNIFLIISLFIAVAFSACAQDNDTNNQSNTNESMKMKIAVGGKEFTATMADNTSAKALVELLTKSPLTIQMQDYGSFEKVGSLGRSFPTNDVQTTTTAGDIVLYQGSSLVIFYGSNSWSYTRLGKIENATADDLKKALGGGDVAVTLSTSK